MMTIEPPARQNGCRFDPALPNPCRTCEVRDLTVCGSLSAREQAVLIGSAVMVTVGARQMLFSDADDADHVFSLIRGRVALSKSLPDGRRHVIRFAGPGNFIGLSSGSVYNTSAESLTDVTFCKFPRVKFVEFALQVPALERLLLTRAEKSVAACIDHMFLLGRKTALERVSSFLAEEAQQFGVVNDVVELDLPMWRNEIGDHLGLTQETVSRCFAQLVKLSVITVPSPHKVNVRDLAKLKVLAQVG